MLPHLVLDLAHLDGDGVVFLRENSRGILVREHVIVDHLAEIRHAVAHIRLGQETRQHQRDHAADEHEYKRKDRAVELNHRPNRPPDVDHLAVCCLRVAVDRHEPVLKPARQRPFQAAIEKEEEAHADDCSQKSDEEKAFDRLFFMVQFCIHTPRLF